MLLKHCAAPFKSQNNNNKWSTTWQVVNTYTCHVINILFTRTLEEIYTCIFIYTSTILIYEFANATSVWKIVFSHIKIV